MFDYLYQNLSESERLILFEVSSNHVFKNILIKKIEELKKDICEMNRALPGDDFKSLYKELRNKIDIFEGLLSLFSKNIKEFQQIQPSSDYIQQIAENRRY